MDSIARIGPGCLVLVVGPSGAGKDTLLRLAASDLRDDARIRFARRRITRPADPVAEDHDSLDEAAFAALVAAGGAALHWRAHGLGYALPVAVDDWIAAGEVVVANVSRTVIAVAAARYARLAVVHVTAPADILRARLEVRGREALADIEERLAPVPVAVPDGVDFVEIRNDHAPDSAACRLTQLLRGMAAWNADGA